MMRSLFVSVLSLPALAQTWSVPGFATALNSTAADTGCHLSLDGLTAHFNSFRSGNWEIYSATRASRTAPFGAPALEANVSDPAAVDNDPFLSADGLTLWLSSSRAGTAGSFDLMRATRPSLVSPWGAPTFVTEVNSTAADASPSLTADGLELYFLTTGWGAPFAPNNAIFVAKRANAASPFGMPTLVAELSNANTHRDVDISTDGLRILYTEFDATRRVRVYQAKRTNRTATFDPPVVLTEFDTVGTTLGVYSVSVTEDGHDMLLAANFAAAAGSQELLTSSFDGLSSVGVPSTTSAVLFPYRDAARPFASYALALAAGNTGFPLGARTVPIDADAIFVASFGTGIPPITTGFFGSLDASGNATGSLTNPLAALIGIRLYAAGFTLDRAAPFGVATISNAVAVELQ